MEITFEKLLVREIAHFCIRYIMSSFLFETFKAPFG